MVAVVEVVAADGAIDGLVGVDELVRDVVPGIVVVVVGCSVVEIRIEVELELGDAAMTPVSGWSFTSEPAALTATYAMAVVAKVARSQSKNRELFCTPPLSSIDVRYFSRRRLENVNFVHSVGWYPCPARIRTQGSQLAWMAWWLSF